MEEPEQYPTDESEPGGYSLRPSRSMRGRIERLKGRLDTPHTSEVIRRALEVYERILDADAVEVIDEGSRHRLLLP